MLGINSLIDYPYFEFNRSQIATGSYFNFLKSQIATSSSKGISLFKIKRDVLGVLVVEDLMLLSPVGV